MGDEKQFKSRWEALAFIGVAPKQHSSGGIKELIFALYQCALSYICQLPDQPKAAKQAWLIKLVQRASIKRSCIALANKTVRTAWAMLRYENQYKQQSLLVI